MFALVHSPLVGPFTWSLLADELGLHGYEVVVPRLHGGGDTDSPYWERHAGAVARELRGLQLPHAPILVGHSGVGPLLPAIRQLLDRSVAGYLFMDAGIPKDGKSRIDLLREELPEAAEGTAREGLSPSWSHEDLREDLPDPRLRAGVLAQIHPQPLAYRVEPIPVFAGWPDAPCGYLRFTPFYDRPAKQARYQGWAYAEMDGGHFHMLVDPKGVADTLIGLTERMGVGLPTKRG